VKRGGNEKEKKSDEMKKCRFFFSFYFTDLLSNCLRSPPFLSRIRRLGGKEDSVLLQDTKEMENAAGKVEEEIWCQGNEVKDQGITEDWGTEMSGHGRRRKG
jgi:hypothetical protein